MGADFSRKSVTNEYADRVTFEFVILVWFRNNSVCISKKKIKATYFCRLLNVSYRNIVKEIPSDVPPLVKESLRRSFPNMSLLCGDFCPVTND